MHNIQSGTSNRKLGPEQQLQVAMLIMALQDLNLEQYFNDYKQFFIIPKSKPPSIINTKSALIYVFIDNYDYTLSFYNVCSCFNINVSSFRTIIEDYIYDAGGLTLNLYEDWLFSNETGHTKTKR